MKVCVERLGNTRILRLQGKIVIGETAVLSRTVISQVHANVVALDLAEVSGIDAAGLGVLLRLREQVVSKGIEFRIMNVTRLIQQVLEMTKLSYVFEGTQERELLSVTARDGGKKVVQERE